MRISGNRVKVCLAAVMSGMAAGGATAQCAEWLAGTMRAQTGGVFTSTVWDIDGAGSLPPVLVMGGRFDRAGGQGIEGQLAGNIAGLLPASSGGGWTGFANGVEEHDGLFAAGGVYKTIVYNGELIAAGSFNLPGNTSANGIARWNGSNWQTLGTSLNGRGCCLAIYNGELIVGGDFTRAGSATVNNVAAWNGASWRSLGAGVTGRDEVVWAAANYGNELVIGGSFDDASGTPAAGIARWNGSRWAAVGAGVPQYDSVYSLYQYGANLYAGGDFDQIGGVNTQGIGRWNGAVWQEVSGGIDGTVWAMRAHNGELVVAGSFWPTQQGLTNVGEILRWDGTRWAKFNQNGYDLFGTVYTLNTWDGKLIAGGNFSTAGGERVDGVATWDGTAWSEIPGVVLDDAPSPNVKSMAVWNGRLVMGGQYRMMDGGGLIDDLAAWNGAITEELPVYADGPVLAMVVKPSGNFQPDQLVIGGSFTTTWFGSDQRNRVALLDWIADTNGRIARPMGAGFNSTVWTLSRFSGQIIAGGDFTASGATAVSRLAKYEGNAWVPFDGLGGFNDTVRAVKAYTATPRNIMVVGGGFTSASGIAANRIAQYSYNTLTGQTSWTSLDGGFNNRVDAIERYGGATYAAGLFTASSTGTPLLRIARFTGGTWQPVGEGFNGPVFSLLADGAYLYAGGRFTASGATPLQNFARWDGTAWTAVDGGANATVNVMAKFHEEMVIGGTFSRVGPGSEGGARHGEVESPLMARFALTGAPWIAIQPNSQMVCRGGSMSLLTYPAAGYTVTYAWRKDGAPVVAGPTGYGSTLTISGPYLFISNAQARDAAVYECTITNECGSATSLTATVRVCAADVNCDDFLDFFDYDDFVAAFETGSPMRIADFNQDGFIDFFDYSDFVVAFEAGC